MQCKIKKLNTPEIEVWENNYPERDYVIEIDIPEFTCICPKTGLPDFADIKIRYIADKQCIELKSLKYYTLFYRDVGIFNENVVNKFMDDFVKAVKPRWAQITGVFNARGGIKTTVVAEYKRGKGPGSPAHMVSRGGTGGVQR